MNENFRQFFEKVAAAPELQAKLSECKSPDEAYAFASSIQEGITKEEFIEEMTKIKDAMEENLTDEDMAKSAGGMDTSHIVSIATISSAAVSGATLAAANAI